MRYVVVSILSVITLYSSILDESLNRAKELNQNSIKAQAKVEELDRESLKILNEYRDIQSKIEYLKSYNLEIETLLKSQIEDISNLEIKMESLKETEQEITPLLIQMLNSIESFIESDLNFYRELRLERVKKAKELLYRDDIEISKKYRAILDIYKIELSYSNSIESFKLRLNDKLYDVLRVGRVKLYAIDSNRAYILENGNLKEIDSSYRDEILKAIELSKDEIAPELFHLPLKAEL